MSANGRTLCCFGAGGHGRVVARQWLARCGGDVVFGDSSLSSGTLVGGIPVLHNSTDTLGDCSVIVTVGDNAIRCELQGSAERDGMLLASFIADSDRYFAREPGAGSVVLAGAVVNDGAVLGRGVIVNSCAVVEHDCEIGDFAHVSPNATLAGGVKLGAGAWIGAGATILPGLVIAPRVVIGAGSVVTRSILEPGIFAGVPARRLSL